jgi:acetyl esterase/lipase
VHPNGTDGVNVGPPLQDITREVIAGVHVYTATPKGFANSSSSSSSRLLVYLHGGAYIKGSCEQLWQVSMSLLVATAAARVPAWVLDSVP